MGRIRTHFVKSFAERVLAAHPNKFSADYETNKRALDGMKIIDEKFTRNRVAGYIVRLAKRKKVAG